ncbi:hypothetical protein TSOC_003287 [Tetrabaena socialis]|uniref:Uncharacterized protein n=1 Tax=Tetrabaena socialis TaxID=47790 RepID=A0A2J8AC25_9CHLO|nr:hypothetical protein TSOC_003287 [Tetrabaena socialis]|eukprot:PNH10047.1 hypothetical protein TSOC_003287 [Tetrabaena socialis]
MQVLGALAAELSGDVLLLVAGLGLQLPTVPPLRNGFRKPDAGEVNANLPKPEQMQGMGAHMAAEMAYDQYMEDGTRQASDKRDPLARTTASPIKARASTNGGVPNWVKAMQADQGGASPMTSGQDIRGIPVIETPDSDEEAPRKPARKSMGPGMPDAVPAMIAQMAGELHRMQAFLGMAPAGTGTDATGTTAGGQAAAPGSDARGVAAEPWGTAGREPRHPGQDVRNLGDVVGGVDQNTRRIAMLEEAMRAGGRPIPCAEGASATTAVAGSTEDQQRQRNAIGVTPGLMPGVQGFGAPGRKQLPPIEGEPIRAACRAAERGACNSASGVQGQQGRFSGSGSIAPYPHLLELIVRFRTCLEHDLRTSFSFKREWRSIAVALSTLPLAAGLPDAAHAELVRLADDLKRVQAFLGMAPAGTGTDAMGSSAGGQAAAPGSDARGVAAEPWGTAGREPRHPGQDVRNLGDVVGGVDQNTRRIAMLEEAMRAGGRPIPYADGASATTAVAGSTEDQQRQRNAIGVSPGLMPGVQGFGAPGRKQLPPIEGLPDAAHAELVRLADDLKRVQAFLGMAPAGTGTDAMGSSAGGQAAAPGSDGRSGAMDQWGQPGREPRDPGQAIRDLGDLVRDVEEYRRRVVELEEALNAAGIPVPSSRQAQAVGVSPASEQAQQRQRNGIAVAPGLVPLAEGATGFAAPRRGPGAGPADFPESLPARVDTLQDDNRRMKAFMGMADGGTSTDAAGPDAPRTPGSASMAAEAGPWAGPGGPRDKNAAEAPPGSLARELEDVKQQLSEAAEEAAKEAARKAAKAVIRGAAKIERALRGAGMGYMLPKEGGAGPGGPTAVQPQPQAAEKQRGAIAVSPGGFEQPVNAYGFPPMPRKELTRERGCLG